MGLPRKLECFATIRTAGTRNLLRRQTENMSRHRGGQLRRRRSPERRVVSRNDAGQWIVSIHCLLLWEDSAVCQLSGEWAHNYTWDGHMVFHPSRSLLFHHLHEEDEGCQWHAAAGIVHKRVWSVGDMSQINRYEAFSAWYLHELERYIGKWRRTDSSWPNSSESSASSQHSRKGKDVQTRLPLTSSLSKGGYFLV